MSELTSCNYCTLKRIQARAKREGKKVTLLPSVFMGGTEVYVHTKHVDIRKLSDKDREQHPSSWLMAIPDHCCC